MDKSLLIIVEGPQGSGKTTVTNYIREHLSYSELFRLTGIEDNSVYGRAKIFKIHRVIMNAIYDLAGLGVNCILDRSFFSEQVYCRLGYKPYRFDGPTKYMCNMLDAMSDDYQIIIFNLQANAETYASRLMNRDKSSYGDTLFDVSRSMDQQEIYYEVLWDYVSGKKNVDIFDIDTTTDYLGLIMKTINRVATATNLSITTK